MRSEDKRAAKAAYKEAKTSAGVFALRCAASNQTWVGQAPNVDTIQNRLWFAMKMGRAPHAASQAAWTAHGEDSFNFEILERMDPDAEAYLVKSRLKDRTEHWRAALAADVI